MPPPLPPPQASRAGLITSVVIFVILWLVSTFVAMKFHTEWQAEIIRHKTDIDTLKPAVTANLMGSNDEIKAVIETGAKVQRTGIEEAIQERNTLSKLITSVGSAPVDAVMNDTIKSVNKVKTTVGAPIDKEINIGYLLHNQEALADHVAQLTKDLAAANQKVTDTDTAKNALFAEQTKNLAAKDVEIAAAKDETAKAQKATEDMKGTLAAQVGQVTTASQGETGAAQAAKDAAIAEVEKVKRELKIALAEKQKVTDWINKFRVNPTRSLLQPAGYITRVPGDNTVFINLGEGKQIWPGLTFEVYDKKKGLPPLTAANPDSPDALVAGKASIEVVRVLPGTSECRIVRTAKGMTIVEGDQILNLIYNTHTKFSFVVFGDFDLGNSGQAANTTEGREVLKNLVVQWGGRVMDHVGVETDFLVLGREIQQPTKVENGTPTDDEKYERQLKVYQTYLDVQRNAIERGIPILNQNRFLYFVGYYDQKNR